MAIFHNSYRFVILRSCAAHAILSLYTLPVRGRTSHVLQTLARFWTRQVRPVNLKIFAVSQVVERVQETLYAIDALFTPFGR